MMNKTSKFFLHLILSILLSCACLLVILLCLGFFSPDSAIHNMIIQRFILLENVGGFSYLDVLDIQISVTFIVISIVTIFSERKTTIYWEDIIQYKLINPKFSNFNAIACYIFVDLIYTILLIIQDSKYAYITFFISILLIMWLSFKMLIAFFSGDYIRRELSKKYALEHSKRLKDANMRKTYREHKRKLIQYTLQAIDTNDIDTVCENMELLYQNKETEDTDYLIGKITFENKFYMLSRIAKVCQQIFGEKDNIDKYNQICMNLLEDNQFEKVGYIKSIFKSMGEYITEQDINQLKYLETIISSFCNYAAKNSHSDLAQQIQNNFHKQKERMKNNKTNTK